MSNVSIDALVEVGWSKKDAKEGADAVLGAILKELQEKGRTQVHGLGVFHIKQVAARTSRNPKTGEPIQVPAKNVVRFKPAKGLKEQINA